MIRRPTAIEAGFGRVSPLDADRTPDSQSKDQYAFDLTAGNGETIATSERYKTKASSKTEIESVEKDVASAPIVDETGE